MATKKGENRTSKGEWPRFAPAQGTAAFDKLPWPSKVPVLTARDMVRDRDTLVDRHDLYRWLELTFNPEEHVYQTTFTIANYLLQEVVWERTQVWDSVTLYCENAKVSLDDLASAWNEMLVRLGYDITTPASREDDYDEYFS